MAFLITPVTAFGQTVCTSTTSIIEASASTPDQRKYIFCCRNTVTITLIAGECQHTQIKLDGVIIQNLNLHNETVVIPIAITPHPCGNTIEVIITCQYTPIPSPEIVNVYESTNAMTLSGSAISQTWIGDYRCFTLMARVKTGFAIDDFGVVGGVIINNNVPCTTVSTVLVDTDVTAVITQTALQTSATVAWYAESVLPCGPPTGVNGEIEFYWKRKLCIPDTLVSIV